MCAPQTVKQPSRARRGANCRSSAATWCGASSIRSHDELNVIAVQPRSSALYRTNARGGRRADRRQSVAAAGGGRTAAAAGFLHRRSLPVRRALCRIAAAVVLNKAELAVDCGIEQELAAFSAAGYSLPAGLRPAACGLERARGLLHAADAMLVGQSGVGKSSLLRRLVPDSDAPSASCCATMRAAIPPRATRLYQVPGGARSSTRPGCATSRRRSTGSSAATGLLRRSRRWRRGAASPIAATCASRSARCAPRSARHSSARRYESYRRLRRLYERLSAERAARRRR